MVFTKRVLGTFAMVLAFVTGCGGGGGAAPAAATATALDSVATLSYKAKSKPTKSFTPWELIELEPVVTGSIGTAARAFIASPALPAGLNLDASTGIISGRTTDVKGGNFQAGVRMSATGYSRDLVGNADFQVEGQLSETASCQGGFALVGVAPGGGWACIGNTGVAGTVRPVASYTLGNVLGSPFPVGTTIVYSLISSTAAGASINASTGVISLTPAAAGAFNLQWAADITNGGVTRRYVGSGFTLTVV
jgi:Putative Ig domain